MKPKQWEQKFNILSLCNKLLFKYILHNMFLFEKYKLIQT